MDPYYAELAGLHAQRRRMPRLPHPSGRHPLHQDQAGLVPRDLRALLRPTRTRRWPSPGRSPTRAASAATDPPPDPTLPTVTFTHEKHSGHRLHHLPRAAGAPTVNPPDYVDPAKMSSCFECHDGSIAPEQLLLLPHAAARGPGRMQHLPRHRRAGPAAAGEAPLRPHRRPRRPGLHRLPREQAGRREHPGHRSCQGRPDVRLLPRGPPRRPDGLRRLPHPDGVDETWTSSIPSPSPALTPTLTCADCHVSKPGGATVPGTQFPDGRPELHLLPRRPPQRADRLRAIATRPRDGRRRTSLIPVVGRARPGEQGSPASSVTRTGFATHSAAATGAIRRGD